VNLANDVGDGVAGGDARLGFGCLSLSAEPKALLNVAEPPELECLSLPEGPGVASAWKSLSEVGSLAGLALLFRYASASDDIALCSAETLLLLLACAASVLGGLSGCLTAWI